MVRDPSRETHTLVIKRQPARFYHTAGLLEVRHPPRAALWLPRAVLPLSDSISHSSFITAVVSARGDPDLAAGKRSQ